MPPMAMLDQGVSLRDLLLEGDFRGARDIVVQSCSSDSRCVQPGDLFVALTGSNVDGHDFVQEAVARGARAILAERLLPMHALPTCIVPDTRSAHGQVCQALAGDPSRQLKVIGVTGTNGKTTTASLIAAVLDHAGLRTGVMGTLGYTDGEQVSRSSHTTPPAPLLAHWLSSTAAAGCSHAVLEVSSRAMAQSRLAGVELDAVCITNVRGNHLDYHGSVLNYRNAKYRLFDHLSASGVAILNADDPVCVDWLSCLDHPALTTGMDHPAELTATVVERFRGEQTFLLSAGSETVPVRTKIIGDHHVANCLIAAALGLTYGIDLPTVVRGLESVQGVPGRMESIDRGQPFGVVVDCADGPDALSAVLTTLREVTTGRLLCVFDADGDGDRSQRPAIGAVVDRLADVVVLTNGEGENDGSRQTIDQIRRGFDRSAATAVETIEDRGDAIRWAFEHARPDDCVLVAGTGRRRFQTAGGYPLPSDDRDLVHHLLDQMHNRLPAEYCQACFG
ncbi:MAG: UDP-N-acetylmuramoyl-L-alanyl-D-glutamate--2,6-diaminopimelate ligase [Pirellulales bacterium]